MGLGILLTQSIPLPPSTLDRRYMGACSNIDFAPGSNSFDFDGNFCQPACRRALFTYFTDFGACQAKCPDPYDYPGNGPDQIQSRLAAMQQSSAVQMSVFKGCGGTVSEGYTAEFSVATSKVWAFTRGASHFTTLDGATYTFNGKGDFWLVKDRHVNDTDVQVQVRMNDECAGSKATCITGIAIATGVAGVNRKVVVVTDSGSGLQATVNGVVSFAGGMLGSAADVLTLGFNKAQVESINGVKIDVTLVEGVIGVGVGVVDDHAGRVAGLYGNFDGDPTNDYAAPGAGPGVYGATPSQASAESYCGSLGSTWSIGYTDAGGGSLYCLKDGTTSDSNCDSCDTYRIVVWKDGGGETKHDTTSYPFNTIAGNVYSAHTTPCSYTPDSLGSPCGTFAAGSTRAPAAPSTQGEMLVGSRVTLSSDYRDYSDASGGPLEPGEIGEITSAYTGSSDKYDWKVGGWWYMEGALQLAPTDQADGKYES